MTLEHMPGAAKLTGDVAAATVLVGTLADALPAIAALVTIIYTGLRIYELRTIQRWVARLTGAEAPADEQASRDGD